MLRLLVSAVVFVCLHLAVNGKTKPDFTEASAILKRAIDDRAFPGCTVAVGTDKKLLWSQALGHFDYSGKQKVTKSTVYDLASLTKVTGTTSVYMRLAGLGKVDFEDPVAKYLPSFVDGAASEEEKQLRQQITLGHLLTHSGAIASWKPFYRTIDSYPVLLDAVIKTPIEGKPGAQSRYSDLGMIMLGEAAGRAGGKPLPDLEQALVFKPLKMNRTLRNPPAKWVKNIPPTEKWPDKETFVHGVVHDENARAGQGNTGHAGLFSTAEDLSKLASELLRGYRGKSRIFPQEVVLEFVREREAGIKKSGRGLGWGVDVDKTEEGESRMIHHTGFTGTSIRIYLDKNYYVILLSNRVHPTRDNGKIGRVRSELSEAVAKTMQ